MSTIVLAIATSSAIAFAVLMGLALSLSLAAALAAWAQRQDRSTDQRVPAPRVRPMSEDWRQRTEERMHR